MKTNSKTKLKLSMANFSVHSIMHEARHHSDVLNFLSHKNYLNSEELGNIFKALKFLKIHGNQATADLACALLEDLGYKKNE